jgi:cysteine synthase
LAANIGITSSNKGCAVAQWAATKFRLHIVVTASKQLSDEGKCAIEMLSSDVENVDAKNSASMEAANQKLTNYGYTIDAASCKVYWAYIGQEGSPFQWCSANPIQKREIKRSTDFPEN